MRLGFIALVVLSLALAPLLNPSVKTEAIAEGVANRIRIGIFPNVTHAAALVALDQGLFQKRAAALGMTVEFVYFNAGPTAIESLKGEAVDLSFVGPNPAVNGFLSTNGDLLRVISGTGANGAQFLVRDDIGSVQELKGLQIASPQLGNTQDIALREFLASEGLATSISSTQGDVTVSPMANAEALRLFQGGQLAGAWVPEPWASRFVLEGGAKVLVDEVSLWPGGQFVTSLLVAKADYLEQYPESVAAVLAALLDAIEICQRQPELAKAATQRQLLELTGKSLSSEVMERAWANLVPTWDPLPQTLFESAEAAASLGFVRLPTASELGSGEARPLNEIFELEILNRLLVERGKPPLSLADQR